MKAIGIFTTDEITALRASSDIIYKYKLSETDVTKHIRTKSNLYVEFSDGTSLKWIRPNTNSRGRKLQTLILILALVLLKQFQQLYFHL